MRPEHSPADQPRRFPNAALVKVKECVQAVGRLKAATPYFPSSYTDPSPRVPQ